MWFSEIERTNTSNWTVKTNNQWKKRCSNAQKNEQKAKKTLTAIFIWMRCSFVFLSLANWTCYIPSIVSFIDTHPILDFVKNHNAIQNEMIFSNNFLVVFVSFPLSYNIFRIYCSILTAFCLPSTTFSNKQPIKDLCYDLEKEATKCKHDGKSDLSTTRARDYEKKIWSD